MNTFVNRVSFYRSIGVMAAILVSTHALGQEKEPYRARNYFDLAVSGANGQGAIALSWAHLSILTRKAPKLKVGYGARFTSFISANKFYVTAPAKYTSPVQDLRTIFSETIAANIDTITTATTYVNALNVSVNIEYSFSRRIDAGFNIDVIGFSFGPERTFNVLSSSFDPGQEPVQKGSPTNFNVLLTSDNDIGSLNSEFFLRYWFNEKIAIRSGLTFFFSEFTLSNNLSFDNGRIMNDRYRYKSAMAMVGITYKPFKQSK